MFEHETDPGPPSAGELKKIPTWIKIMWAFGILFILSYIYQGLKNL